MSKRPFGYLKEPKNLIYDFKKRAKKGKKLNPYALAQDDQSLYMAILREFDSFNDFLRECGYDPEDIRVQQKWTLNKLSNELNKIYKQNIKIKYHNKQKNYDNKQYKIFRMLIYYFDSIKAGLEHFNYTLTEDKRLEKICPKCKKTIIPFKSNRIICEDCQND